jgi:hypothetical protein
MDESAARLKEKFEKLMKEAAATAVALSRADGTVEGVPHYSVIELHAHQLGRQLSREIQQQQMTEVAIGQALRAKCPKCGTVCELGGGKRAATSIDGPVEIQELKGHCRRCRRDFFPATGSIGP